MFRTKWFLAVVCVSVFCGSLVAQEFRATITGRVLDASNAVVPNVKIVAIHTETQSKTETVTSADGEYTLTYLAPGSYRLTAESAGFKRYQRDGLALSTGQRLGLDITLEVGATTESVTVTADAPLLTTTTASTGQVITSRQIENLPMNGRTPLSLAQIAFGVTAASDPRFQRPFDNAGPSGFSMGGAPAQSNELLINGAPDNTRNGRVAYNPPVDTVSEVKVEVFQTDAAYGHTGGGTVNVVMKGGTNSFHGSAYEFNQVSALAGTPFFINRAGQKKVVSRYNQWGVTAGGPVFIPKLYDGRDKLFVFVAYEGIKDAQPESLTSTVPTAAERRGDFSQLLTVGSNYQLYNPFAAAREGSRVRRQPFVGNVIPTALLNPIALKYLEYYPAPNQPGRADGQDNYLAASTRSDTFNSQLGRLDFNFSDRHKMFYDFRHNYRVEDRGNRFKNIGTGNFLSRVNWGTTLDDVYTITPTLLLNTRLNWTRFTEGNQRPSDGFDFTSLGFPASLKTFSARLVLPTIDMDRFTDLGNSGGDLTPYDTFQIFSTLTYARSKHSLKFGGDIREAREASYSYGNSSGSYTFRSDWTRGPLDNSTAAPLGQDLATLLLGLPTGGSFDINASRVMQAKYLAVFAQDDWRVTRNLTLNLGLRYERDFPTTERFNRTTVGFDFNTPNPISAAALAAYARAPIAEVPVSQFKVNGGLLFAGSGNEGVYDTHGYFSPRFGFAWKPDLLGGKNVVRGGFGVFFASSGATSVNDQQHGFSQSTSFVSTLDGLLTPNDTFSSPFRAGVQQPTGSSRGLATFLGQGIRFRERDQRNPYSIRWSFGIQRELTGNTVIEVGYIGNHAVHIPVNFGGFNFVPRQFLSTSQTRDQAVIDRNTANVTNPFAGLIPGTGRNGSTIQRQELLRPYPQFTSISVDQRNEGSSYFHMLAFRVDKRFARSFQAVGSYQWSKLMSRTNRLNDSDPFLEKRIANDDRTHRFVFSGNWNLPLGRGHAFGGNANKVVNGIISGWNINGIINLQSGGPLGDWGNVIYLGGDLKLDGHNVDGAFDTTRFNTNSAQQLAQNIRTFPNRFGNLRSDRFTNVNASIVKDIGITERIKLQFRCEFFNLMNHPIFNSPELNPTSSNFGKITGQANEGTGTRITQLGLRLVW